MVMALLLVACGRGAPSTPAGSKPAAVLTLDTGERLADPTDGQIRLIISTLGEAPESDGSAMLERSEMTFLQVTGEWKTGFILEYREGDEQPQYESDRRDFSVEEVIRAFTDFRDGTIDWSTYGTWSPVIE
jgi:hypothetical protein